MLDQSYLLALSLLNLVLLLGVVAAMWRLRLGLASAGGGYSPKTSASPEPAESSTDASLPGPSPTPSLASTEDTALSDDSRPRSKSANSPHSPTRSSSRAKGTSASAVAIPPPGDELRKVMSCVSLGQLDAAGASGDANGAADSAGGDAAAKPGLPPGYHRGASMPILAHFGRGGSESKASRRHKRNKAHSQAQLQAAAAPEQQPRAHSLQTLPLSATAPPGSPSNEWTEVPRARSKSLVQK